MEVFGALLESYYPILGFILIPFFNHILTKKREKVAFEHRLIEQLEDTFEKINTIFHKSVILNLRIAVIKKKEDKLAELKTADTTSHNLEKEESTAISHELEDSQNEQKMLALTLQCNTYCERFLKLNKRNKERSVIEANLNTIRRIATNDRRRKPEYLAESTGQITDAQRKILSSIER